eukprot:scaffold59541_cov31-Prasinocladus_malaysianus.AAC.1
MIRWNSFPIAITEHSHAQIDRLTVASMPHAALPLQACVIQRRQHLVRSLTPNASRPVLLQADDSVLTSLLQIIEIHDIDRLHRALL